MSASFFPMEAAAVSAWSNLLTALLATSREPLDTLVGTLAAAVPHVLDRAMLGSCV
jgi:hypothetical protein